MKQIFKWALIIPLNSPTILAWQILLISFNIKLILNSYLVNMKFSYRLISRGFPTPWEQGKVSQMRITCLVVKFLKQWVWEPTLTSRLESSISKNLISSKYSFPKNEWALKKKRELQWLGTYSLLQTKMNKQERSEEGRSKLVFSFQLSILIFFSQGWERDREENENERNGQRG